jgi:2-polyprenyl-3-methyl-5-hydroxy-6-metoxy-1,4-benzoquinol methylase
MALPVIIEVKHFRRNWNMPASFQDVPITKVSDYWNSRPCNIAHSPQPVGSREYFDEVEARKYCVEPHIPGFAEFERWKGKRVLEIGCGIGTDTLSFARGGAQVTAIDLTEKSLAVARQRAEVFGVGDRVRFIQANAERLSESVPVEPYDLIYSFGVIHHTPHPERVLEEIRRYVTPESTVKIMVYNRWSWKVLWILFIYGKGRFWKLNRLVADYSEAELGCPVTYCYSRAAGRRLLDEHGFRVTGVQVDHIFPYSIPEYVQYRYKMVWYFRWMPKALFRVLERAFGWHLCLTAKPK